MLFFPVESIDYIISASYEHRKTLERVGGVICTLWNAYHLLEDIPGKKYDNTVN